MHMIALCVLSGFRLISPAPVAALFFIGAPWAFFVAAIVIALAGITDFLDGYFARRWKASSTGGAILDRAADKASVLILIFVMGFFDVFSPWSALCGALIILREIAVSALREGFPSNSLPSSILGKCKTVAQFFALGAASSMGIFADGTILLFLSEIITDVSMGLAAFLGFMSLRGYFRAAGSASS